MDKYNSDQLQQMARTILYARINDSDRYLTFIMTMMFRTGLTDKEVYERIVKLAGDE